MGAFESVTLNGQQSRPNEFFEGQMLFHASSIKWQTSRSQPLLTAAADVLGSNEDPQAETKTETETKT
ncbi:hypothetical protein FPOAC2_10907 [Fusarium poae]|jgi:hypothetical protein